MRLTLPALNFYLTVINTYSEPLRNQVIQQHSVKLGIDQDKLERLANYWR